MNKIKCFSLVLIMVCITSLIMKNTFSSTDTYDVCQDYCQYKSLSDVIDVIGVRNNSYSSSYGMIKYFIEKLKLRGREYTMFNEDKEYKLVEERKNSEGFSFGKFFEYFFNNKED